MASVEEQDIKMQFVLELGGRCGPRMGKLVWTTPPSLPASSTVAPPLTTPLCFLYSRGGAIPNLTRDLEEEVVHHVTGSKEDASSAILLTMPTMYNNTFRVLSTDVLNQFQKGIHAFLKRERQLLYLSSQDPATPADYRFNEAKTVSVWSKHGRSKVTVSDHLQLLKAHRPNLFECLYDSAPSRENKMKRIRKSVDRTLSFLDETVAGTQESKELQGCGLLGVIVGSDVISERLRSAKLTAERPTDGFVLEGFDEHYSFDCLKEVLIQVNQCLPDSKPRFIHGLHKPEEIFCAVECGVDVFESSYSYTAAEKGLAVVFPRGEMTSIHTSEASPESSDDAKLKYETSRPFEIDLNDPRYADDFSPFLPGCPCYACSHHTRAYTHHLLNTNEILAKILLTMHNLTHYLSFFAALRHCIEKSTFQNFKSNCLQQ